MVAAGLAAANLLVRELAGSPEVMLAQPTALENLAVHALCGAGMPLKHLLTVPAGPL